jgi:hypothetical protein
MNYLKSSFLHICILSYFSLFFILKPGASHSCPCIAGLTCALTALDNFGRRDKYQCVLVPEEVQEYEPRENWTQNDRNVRKLNTDLSWILQIKHHFDKQSFSVFVCSVSIFFEDSSIILIMSQLQVLHNKAAKLILDLPIHASATNALISIHQPWSITNPAIWLATLLGVY